MKELYYFLSILFYIFLWYIAYQDYKTKLIFLWSFYILNVLWIFYVFFNNFWYEKYLLVVYFILIFLLDILDYFWKLPKFISKNWMIWWTWIYDYWIYLFILVFFIHFLHINFFSYYIWFTISIILWVFISYFLTKKRYKKHIPLFVYGFFIISFMSLTIFILK